MKQDKNIDPEEFLRSFDCKVIDNKVYYEQKFAVNAIDEYAKKYGSLRQSKQEFKPEEELDFPQQLFEDYF